MGMMTSDEAVALERDLASVLDGFAAALHAMELRATRSVALLQGEPDHARALAAKLVEEDIGNLTRIAGLVSGLLREATPAPNARIAALAKRAAQVSHA